MDKYKEIEIKKPGSVVVEFEDDATPDTKEEAIEDVSLEKAVEPAVKKEEVFSEVKPAVEKQSRYQKRIKQLLEREKAAIEMAEKERQEKEELKKLLQENTKTSKASVKETLENQIKILTSSLKEAMQSGNSDLAIELQDDLMNAKMELAMVKHELKTAESAPKETEAPIRPTAPQLPEAAIIWIEDHPAFNTDQKFRTATINVNNQMLGEGWDIESDEFYEELSARLSKRFPKEFGIEEKSHVESKEIKKSSDDEQEDVKEKASTVKARTVEQTVSGSSRSATMAVNSPVKKNSVTLTPEDIAQAEAWGLTLEQMARRIAHTNANKRADGYVPIFINKQ